MIHITEVLLWLKEHEVASWLILYAIGWFVSMVIFRAIDRSEGKPRNWGVLWKDCGLSIIWPTILVMISFFLISELWIASHKQLKKIKYPDWL